MHDRLVSRRIDALHQCFLVNTYSVDLSFHMKLPTYGHKRTATEQPPWNGQ